MSPDTNVVTLPAAPVPPSFAAPAPPPPPVDDGISAMSWLREMREMRHEQQKERREQTDAFVAALDKLGGRIDGGMTTMRAEMRRHLNVLVLTFALSFLVLGGLAGIGIYLRAFGITAQTSALAPTASAPSEAP